MTKGLFKDFIREIRRSLNRFISILCIVAIGTAFFVGLKSAAPDMSYTMDSFYDKYRVMDLEVMSTLGLTQEDIDTISALDTVEQVQPAYLTDALTYSGGMEIVFRLHSIPRSYLDGDDSAINQLELVEGRMPEKPDEIVVEYSKNKDLGIRVGDTLTFESGTAKVLTEGVLHGDTFHVVGMVTTPYYLTFDKGNSQINGKPIGLFGYIPEEAFDYDGIFTEALIRVKDAAALNAFEDKYKDLVSAASVTLNNIGVDRAKLRGESLKDEAYRQLEEGQAELDAQLELFNTEIAAAEQELEAARQKLVDGEKQLAIEKEKYELEIKHAEQEIADGEKELADAAEKIREGEAAVERGEKAVAQARAEYEAALAQNQKYLDMLKSLEASLARLDKQMQSVSARLEELKNDPEANAEQIAMYEALYEEYQKIYNETNQNYQDIVRLNQDLEKLIVTIEATLNAAEDELANARQELANARKEYNDGKRRLEAAKAQMASAQAEAEQKFGAAQAEIDAGWTAYNEGAAELAAKRAEGEQKINEGELQIIEAKHQIDLMENAVWYVLDRNMNYGFASYQSTVDRMNALAQIMPVFFILVAVLVCMTTMTRMVTEQRGTIGTYKALGYDDNAITSKYVLYVALASLIGALIGAGLGMAFFPRSVYMAWSAMYVQPEFRQTFHPVIMIVSLIVSVVAMILTAGHTCHMELISVPAQLMRPKAPKMGKTILLERIPAIWNHLNFSQKVTARNIFRYKKRLYMTVIGIMGCTALLLAGLGLDDTISTVVENQFEKVFRYDVSAVMKETATDEEKQAIVQKLEGLEGVEEFSHVGAVSFVLTNDNTQVMATGYVTEQPDTFPEYIALQQRRSGTPLELTDDGIVLTEKLADQLGVSVGDSVDVQNGDGIAKKLKVTGITENYVFHYAYMTQNCYESNFWYKVNQSTILLKLADGLSTDEIADICEQIEQTEGISSVMSFTEVASDFQKQIVALKSIIVLIIVCAALLAFVVLYNLTNINISERIKEIATIKVLGFKSDEVALYVYRENFLLTLIGGVLGLVLGVGLHRVIMKSIEQSNVMFGYLIDPSSFVLALVMTCVFSILVMLYMYRKLTRIPMVESLKAVE